MENIEPMLCELPPLLSFLLHHFSLSFSFCIFSYNLRVRRKSVLSKANPGSHILGLTPFCLFYHLPTLNFQSLFLLFDPSLWAVKHTQVSLILVIVLAFSKPTVFSLPFPSLPKLHFQFPLTSSAGWLLPSPLY